MKDSRLKDEQEHEKHVPLESFRAPQCAQAGQAAASVTTAALGNSLIEHSQISTAQTSCSFCRGMGAWEPSHTGRKVHKRTLVGAICVHSDLHLGGFQIHMASATVMQHFQSLNISSAISIG